MKHSLVPVAFLTALLSLSACERKVVIIETVPSTPIPEPVAKTKTLETSRLGTAIDNYAIEPTDAHKAEVNKAMARLDEEIAELQEYIAKHDGDDRAKAAAKLANLQSYRNAEMIRFTTAQAKGSVETSRPVDSRTGADKAKDAVERARDSVQDAGRKATDTVKDLVHPN